MHFKSKVKIRTSIRKQSIKYKVIKEKKVKIKNVGYFK